MMRIFVLANTICMQKIDKLITEKRSRFRLIINGVLTPLIRKGNSANKIKEIFRYAYTRATPD